MGNLPVFLCFRHSLRLFVAIPGQPNANRGFSIFSKKLILLELGWKFIDLGSKLKDLAWKFGDLGWKFKDLGLKCFFVISGGLKLIFSDFRGAEIDFFLIPRVSKSFFSDFRVAEIDFF